MAVAAGRTRFGRLALVAIIACGGVVRAQAPQYPKPTELPNPYRLVAGWPTLPQHMNGGHWGEVIRVHVDDKGTIWVFHRCFNVVPAGQATCIGRGPANPPILQFDPSGRLLKSFGAGLFAYNHGFTVDGDGNLWVTDVNDQETILGMPARNAAGKIMGQEVLKLSPDGKVLMMLGKEGVAGSGPDGFDRPTSVAVAPNGDVFVSDGHAPNRSGAGRVAEVVARLSGAWVDGSLLGDLLRVSCENPVTPHSKIRTMVEADLARLIIKTVRAAAKSRDDSVPTCDAKGILTRPDYSQAKN